MQSYTVGIAKVAHIFELTTIPETFLHMGKLLLTGLLLLAYQFGTSQNLVDHDKVESIQLLYQVIDTIQSVDKSSLTLNIKWMDSSIQIRKTTRIKYDLDVARKFRRDPTYIPLPIDTLRTNEMRKSFSQNCHSYALENYFKNELVKDGSLFNQWTVLTENYHMDKILVTAFVKTKSFDTKRKKCKDCFFSKGTLIVFRNNWNSPIHTVYYDGTSYYSKYGGGPVKNESNIESILKIYWDTKTIEEYRLDHKTIKTYLDNRKS